MGREIKFRVWSYEDKEYRTDCNLTQVFNSMTGMPATVYSDEGDRFDIEQYTGLKDKNDKEIYEGDILRFNDDNGIWQAPVVFERGLFGLDVHNPKQIKNPDGWDKEYDKIDSRWWGTEWGYEEFGTAFTYRTPLAKATIFRGSSEEYQNSEQERLNKKYGYDSYYVMAEVVGNIHENPELIGGE